MRKRRTNANKAATLPSVLADYNTGVKVRQISERYNVAVSTIFAWLSESGIKCTRQNKQIEHRDEAIKLHNDGASVSEISKRTGVPDSTIYAWIGRNKSNSPTVSYSKQFKRNVIQSLHDGRSKIEVSDKYGITIAIINDIINEFKNGAFDVQSSAPIAIKTTTVAKAIEKPAIQTMSVAALDDFCDVFKLLVSKGLDVDNASDAAKQISLRK